MSMISNEDIEILHDLDAETPRLLQPTLAEIVALAPRLTKSPVVARDFPAAARLIGKELKGRLSFSDEREFRFAMRCFVVRLAISLARGPVPNGIAPSILALYPRAFTVLTTYLKSHRAAPYMDNLDYLIKDFRFVLGLSVPCGAQALALVSRVAPTTMVNNFVQT